MPNSVLLWNKTTNTPEAVDAGAVRDKLSSGSYAQYAEGAATIDGQPKDLLQGGAFTSPLDRGQLGEALGSDLERQQTEHTARVKEELFGGAANMLRAGAQGFGSAATLGLLGEEAGSIGQAV